MKLFYNLLFKHVHIYIYLSTNLLFITFITLLLQSFKTFENRSNNREHTHIYYTVIKREDNSSLDEPPSKTWKRKTLIA